MRWNEALPAVCNALLYGPYHRSSSLQMPSSWHDASDCGIPEPYTCSNWPIQVPDLTLNADHGATLQCSVLSHFEEPWGQTKCNQLASIPSRGLVTFSLLLKICRVIPHLLAPTAVTWIFPYFAWIFLFSPDRPFSRNPVGRVRPSALGCSCGLRILT